MAAQLITIAKAGEEASGDDDDDIPPYRPPPVGVGVYRPLPIGVLNVFGQAPVKVGHFENVAKLLDAVHAQKILPGRSNTIFATVGNLRDVQSPPVRTLLERLPDELTIIAHEGKSRG